MEQLDKTVNRALTDELDIGGDVRVACRRVRSLKDKKFAEPADAKGLAPTTSTSKNRQSTLDGDDNHSCTHPCDYTNW